jgi:hypothetical protein
VSVASWYEIYASDLQGVYALWVVPTIFLVYLLTTRRRRELSLVAPGATRFIRAYAVAFTVETIVDPLASGPLLRWLGLAGGWPATAVTIVFVLLGDFRVFLLVFFLTTVGRRRSTGRPAEVGLGGVAGRAAAWTLIVPLATVAAWSVLKVVVHNLPAHSIWLVYELAFVVMALVLRGRVVPGEVPSSRPELRAYLRDVTAYVALYYALWAGADVLILAADVDEGWALRMLPNQLYYALYVPLAYGLFLSHRYASISSSTQASR